MEVADWKIVKRLKGGSHASICTVNSSVRVRACMLDTAMAH
jgi:hypothetical protein